MTNVLVVSTLFPNAEQRNHGIFVENRLRATLKLGGLDATVLAPVPYFPFRANYWGKYGVFARVPAQEQRSGISVLHPRFVVVPKVGTTLGPQLLFRAARRAFVRQLQMGAKFDVIDAHYFYPDGVAAAMLAREFKLPLVITGRGSDLTLIPRNRIARQHIVWAAQQASALITVSQSLKHCLVELGVAAEKIAVLRNGVDTDLFRPAERSGARASLGLPRFTLLSVGGLIPRKRHDMAIDAMRELHDCELLIVGVGPLRNHLERHAEAVGVSSRVRFVGEVAHEQLPLFYSAADAMLLMSDREGWANVILESMACGTPVIATDVGGAGEIIRAQVAGRLLRDRNSKALVQEVQGLRANLPPRALTRRYAEAFGWAPVATANKALLIALAQRQTLRDVAKQFSVSGPLLADGKAESTL